MGVPKLKRRQVRGVHSVPVTITIPSTLLDLIDAYADRCGRSRSEVVCVELRRGKFASPRKTTTCSISRTGNYITSK